MKTMSVGDFKAKFSQVLQAVEKGESIAIAYGKQKTIKAILVPNTPKKAKRKPQRRLGILEGKASFKILPGFKMTEEEFLSGKH